MPAALVSGQHASNTGNSVSFPSRPTAGNCLIACVQGYGASSVGSVKLGGLADNWTALATVSGGGQVAAIWADPGCGSASSSVAFTSSGATQQNIQVYEFSGLGAGPSEDVSPATFLQTTTSSISWSSGTTPTAGASDLWLGMFAGNQANAGYSATVPGSPWNCPEGKTSQTGAGNETIVLVSGYQIPGVAGRAGFSGNQSSSSAVWAAIAVALAPGAGAPPASGGSGSFLSFF